MPILKVPVTDADHSEGGDAKAPVTLVEYGDYECPACGEAFPIVKAVQKHFGRRLRFVFRNFPLTQIHPEAESAAETAEFAAGHSGRCTMRCMKIRTSSGRSFTWRSPSGWGCPDRR